MRTNASLRQLEVFLLVSRLNSFSDAARTLRLTPSALSRNIHQLETTLSVRLFDRSTRTVVLTAEGAEFALTARRVLEEFDRGIDHFSQFVGGQRGRVDVSALPSVAVSILAPLIAKFEQQHPQAEVFIHDTIAGGAFKAVRDGKADFGLTCCLQSDEDIQVEPLVTDGFFVLCRDDHPLAEKEVVVWKDFAQHRYIGSAPKSSVRFYTDSAFTQVGVKMRNAYEPVGLATVASLVMQGLGVTALPGLVLPLVELPGLTHRPLHHPKVIRQICLLTKISRPQSPLSLALAALLRQEVRVGLLKEKKFQQLAWCYKENAASGKVFAPVSGEASFE